MGSTKVLKIVWLEDKMSHCIFGELVSEDSQFMLFKTREGNTIQLGKSYIVKIEQIGVRS